MVLSYCNQISIHKVLSMQYSSLRKLAVGRRVLSLSANTSKWNLFNLGNPSGSHYLAS